MAAAADSNYIVPHSQGGGQNFERPNVERLIIRNLKITSVGQNFEQ